MTEDGLHAVSTAAKAGDGAGDDLHGDADHPSRHDQGRPGDVRIVAEHDRAHGSESRPGREKGADRAQEFRAVDLAVPAAASRTKGQGWGVDAKLKSNAPAKHHLRP